MKKKSGFKIGVVGLVFFLLVFGVVFISKPFSTYSPMSITKYEFIENGETFGQTWRIVTSTIKGGERIIGTVNNQDFVEQTGNKPVKDFTLDITNNEQLEYYVTNQNIPIYQLNVISGDEYGCVLPSISHAESFAQTQSNVLYYAVFKKPYSFKCKDYVITRNRIGTVGDFKSRTIVSTSEVCLIPEGDSKSCLTVKNTGERNAMNNKFKVSWAGLTLSGYSIPELRASDGKILMPVYTIGSNGWHLATEYDYLQYNKYSNQNSFAEVKATFDDAVKNSDSFKELQNTLQNSLIANKYALRLIKTTPYSISQSKVTSVKFGEKYSADGTILTAKPTQEISYSQLIIDIDAGWIGIERTSGKPKILSATSKTYESGSGDGLVKITVTNRGTAEGTFSTTMDCDYPFYALDQNTDDFRVGQTRSFDLRFRNSGSCAENPTGTCKIISRDISSGESDSETVTVSCTGVKICEPNTRFCDPSFKHIEECNSEGTASEIIKICPEGTVCSMDQNRNPFCLSGTLEDKTCEERCEINSLNFFSKFVCQLKCGITSFFVDRIWFFVGFFTTVIIGGILLVIIYLKFKR